MLVLFQITLGMDFLWILVEIWLQVGVQNGAKIDIKGGWKNHEKMMMARMAKKLDIGGYEAARHPCPEPRGGGRRRAKPLLQGLGRMWSWKDEGMRLDTQTLNHLSPRGLVGFVFLKVYTYNH